MYDKGKIAIRNTASAKVNVTFGNIADFSVGLGKEHSFKDLTYRSNFRVLNRDILITWWRDIRWCRVDKCFAES